MSRPASSLSVDIPPSPRPSLLTSTSRPHLSAANLLRAVLSLTHMRPKHQLPPPPAPQLSTVASPNTNWHGAQTTPPNSPPLHPPTVTGTALRRTELLIVSTPKKKNKPSSAAGQHMLPRISGMWTSPRRRCQRTLDTCGHLRGPECRDLRGFANRRVKVWSQTQTSSARGANK